MLLINFNILPFKSYFIVKRSWVTGLKQENTIYDKIKFSHLLQNLK